MGYTLNSPGGGIQNFPGIRSGNSTRPRALAGAVNNWLPENFGDAEIIYCGQTANTVISGIQGGFSNRVLTILFIGSFEVQIPDESVLSLAPNRMHFGQVGAYLTSANSDGAMISLCYDGSISRWRMLGSI